MESDSCNDIDSNESVEESADFGQVTAIVSKWVLDFCFSSLCRLFRERNLNQFNHTLGTLDAICQGCKLSNEQAQRKNIAGFLGRIMNGKQLDLVYGKGNNLMPMMAATCVWNTLRDTVADEDSYQGISNLLRIQSVAVCLEQGQRNMASTALQWLEKKQDIPKNMAIKLSLLVAKGNIRHPFLRNFSYEHLLEKVQAYLDAFRAGKPASDFLLQAATRMANYGQNGDASGNHDEPSSDETTEQPPPAAKETAKFSRPKKRRLATKQAALWVPASAKKPRKSEDDGRQGSTSSLMERSPNKPAPRARRGKKGRGHPWKIAGQGEVKQKWTEDLDERLIEGVRKHGEGHWKQILLDHDFGDRTGTMLKDRWRILKRDTIL